MKAWVQSCPDRRAMPVTRVAGDDIATSVTTPSVTPFPLGIVFKQVDDARHHPMKA